jgi:RNA polymerase sigma-70 factor, ECF subfamily
LCNYYTRKPNEVKQKSDNEFSLLYDPIHDQLVRYCRAVAGNRQDAEDLVNDTIVSAMESYHRLKDKNSLKPYLFGIARNLNKMRLRRKKLVICFDNDESRFLTDTSIDPVNQADFQLIYEKIMSLPARMSEAMILFHISDLSLEDIRKIQGGSLSGVKLRLKRGREKLMSALGCPAQIRNAVLIFTL